METLKEGRVLRILDPVSPTSTPKTTLGAASSRSGVDIGAGQLSEGIDMVRDPLHLSTQLSTNEECYVWGRGIYSLRVPFCLNCYRFSASAFTAFVEYAIVSLASTLP